MYQLARPLLECAVGEDELREAAAASQVGLGVGAQAVGEWPFLVVFLAGELAAVEVVQVRACSLRRDQCRYPFATTAGNSAIS